MARSYKDDARRRYFNSYWQQDHILLEGFGWRLAKTTKPKLRKRVDTEDHYLSGGPSWWNNLFHTRPIRGKFRNYTKYVVRCPIEYIDELLEPSDSKRPHKYFW
jgi:hypothetical protein